jgi:hypothetical protein
MPLPARLTAVRLSIEARGPATGWCFSHSSAAHLLKLSVPEPARLNVLLVPSRNRLRLDDVEVHVATAGFRSIRTEGFPVTPSSMAVLTCATELPRVDLLHLIEDAVRGGRLRLADLRLLLGRGKAGAAALRDVLDELDGEGLDRWVRTLVRQLVKAGLPRPELEVPIHDGGRLFACLDGYFPDAALAVEVDDWATHASRAAQERDRLRDRWLRNNRGIGTLRTTPREIRDRPATVVSDVVETYRQRRK